MHSKSLSTCPESTCPEKPRPTSQETDTSALLSTRMGQNFAGAPYLPRKTLSNSLFATILTIAVSATLLLNGCGSSTPEPTPTPPPTETPSAPPTVPAPATPDIIAALAAVGDFTKLLAAIEEADLGEKLQSSGPFTLFAPTDSAFDALPADALSDPDRLFDILLYHIIADEVAATDLQDGMTLTTLLGDELSVTAQPGQILIDGAALTTPDIEANNGVIHLLDRVLMPPGFAAAPVVPLANLDLPNIVQTAQTNGGLETLMAGLEAAELLDQLQGDGPFTILAPTDEAFLNLVDSSSEELIDRLDTEPGAFLLYHVIPGALSSTAVRDGLELQTLEGSTISFSTRNGGSEIYVRGGGLTSALLTAIDLPAGNGFIHIIDSVILPPSVFAVP